MFSHQRAELFDFAACLPHPCLQKGQCPACEIWKSVPMSICCDMHANLRACLHIVEISWHRRVPLTHAWPDIAMLLDSGSSLKLVSLVKRPILPQTVFLNPTTYFGYIKVFVLPKPSTFVKQSILTQAFFLNPTKRLCCLKLTMCFCYLNLTTCFCCLNLSLWVP